MATTATRTRRERSYELVESGERSAPLPDLSTMPAPMVRNRELLHAYAAAAAFEAWLAGKLSGVPADQTWAMVACLWVSLEAELVERAMHPDRFAVEGEDDEPDDVAEPHALGMSIVGPRPTRERPRAAIHPGCQRHLLIADGATCDGLRRYGDRLCPPCTTLYLAQQRAARRAA
jgi:hypothetical protein